MSSPQTVIIPTCRHILANGAFCSGAAVKAAKYCRHHIQSRLRCRNMARERRRLRVVNLPPLLDARAIHTAIARVRVAAAAHRLDPDTARVMQWALRMSADNVFDIEHSRPPKPNQLYHIPINNLDSITYTRNVAQVIENTRSKKDGSKPFPSSLRHLK